MVHATSSSPPPVDEPRSRPKGRRSGPHGLGRYLPFIVCSLFAGVGFLLLYKAHTESRLRAQLKAEGVATEGVVSRSFEVQRSADQRRKDQRPRYASIIEYRDTQGQVHSLRLEGAQERDRSIGDAVPVVFDPVDPRRGLVVGHEQEGLFALRLVGGLLVVGSVLVVLVVLWRRIRQRGP